MSTITPLIPRQPVPDLAVQTVGDPLWRLADQKPEHFTLITFYRGLHCPVCARYLADLESKLDDFAQRGVSVIAISSDTEERAVQAKERWALPRLMIGWGLDLDAARRWGLYLSAGHGKTTAGIEEPALFSEPGLFLVRPDGTLYFATVQTMPFARPSFGEILQSIEFVIARNYPARGEIVE